MYFHDQVEVLILKWYLSTNNRADYMSKGDVTRAVQAHAEEFMFSYEAGNYTALEDYMAEIEETEEWY